MADEKISAMDDVVTVTDSTMFPCIDSTDDPTINYQASAIELNTYFQSKIPTPSTVAFVTIGAFADYPTYFAAWTAGKFFTIQLDTTITETQQFTFESSQFVYMIGNPNCTVKFGDFNILTDGVLVNFLIEGMSIDYDNPTGALFYVDPGSNITVYNSFITPSDSVLFFNNNDDSINSSFNLINCNLTYYASTGGFKNLDSLLILGGTITGQDSCSTFITDTKYVSFSPNFVQGDWANGQNLFIDCQNIAFEDAEFAGSGDIGEDSLIIEASSKLYAKNIKSITMPIDFKTTGNALIDLDNVKTEGLITITDGDNIDISGCILDNINNAVVTVPANIRSANTLWLASSGSFTYEQNGYYQITSDTVLAGITTVDCNRSQINGLLTGGLFQISSLASEVKCYSINSGSQIQNFGTNCIIDGYSATEGLIGSSAVASSLCNGIITGTDVTVSSGATDCTVFNTKAQSPVIDNGTNTQQALNLPQPFTASAIALLYSAPNLTPASTSGTSNTDLMTFTIEGNSLEKVGDYFIATGDFTSIAGPLKSLSIRPQFSGQSTPFYTTDVLLNDNYGSQSEFKVIYTSSSTALVLMQAVASGTFSNNTFPVGQVTLTGINWTVNNNFVFNCKTTDATNPLTQILGQVAYFKQ